ncbi:hypothetical protein WUBG_04505 [Wuchereria bancrofti]|uniref:Helicase ATP-binding domain-containing protein n=1 Tax=Wuchereria bancrofti TaxID=6293 RepID=J9F543_WUCBA|nr:hypothetical protein WUBG_04505 [Wuchereria bancrofti]
MNMISNELKELFFKTYIKGGLDLKTQEAALRQRPDIVIATPGRLIDHLHNAPNFSLADVEILVLDEADRMLDEAFSIQMKEIIHLCARNRQTMLFSATMTDQVYMFRIPYLLYLLNL